MGRDRLLQSLRIPSSTYPKVRLGQYGLNACLNLTRTTVMMYSNFAIFCNGIAMCAMKLGIGISMLRLQLSKRFNIAVYVAIAISLVVNLTVFFGCFAICRPIERIWNLGVEGHCWPKWWSLVFSYTQTGMKPGSSPWNMLTDVQLAIS
jgi:hypothetical protein